MPPAPLQHKFKSVLWLSAAIACLFGCNSVVSGTHNEPPAPIAIVIHGGAGTITRESLTPEAEEAIRGALSRAVQLGYQRLRSGDSSLNAVTAAITALERSPLFNAGVGAVYTWNEEHELDASIMDGRTLNAGAVAGVKTIASPIAAARAVMESSEHVLLSGAGAESFAQSQGIATVPNSHFNTQPRRQALEKLKSRQNERYPAPQSGTEFPDRKFGTVGAVALDSAGNLAAGTSTGGMTGKRWGRIGDSPIIGAGTYADNRSCAVSATGHGEFFIRYNVAADICARVRFLNLSLAEAGQQVLFEELLPAGGTGGVIILNTRGDIATPFNTEGMYRASVDRNGQESVSIYRK